MSDAAAHEDATARQQRASHPAVSAWVSANAGSGKTRVLADRVVRLLLEGTPPERILCLTFTKAAAAEMASRIFATLGNWVLLDDDALTEAIFKVQGKARFDPAFLARARRLFAEALETPGGLKIQTIHAFCEGLLHRFPLEADVPPGFDVLDDLSRAELLGELRADILRAASGEGNPLGDPLRLVVSHVQPQDFDAILDEILSQRADLTFAHERLGGLDALDEELRTRHGLDPGANLETIIDSVVGDALPRDEFEAAEEKLRQGSTNDGKFADRLRATLNATTGEVRFEALLDAFLTKDRGMRKTPVTKSLQQTFPELLPWAEHWQGVALAALHQYRAAATCAATHALLQLAFAILEKYDDAKRRRGVLDYDDLITKSVDLLDGTDAAWVLYKLDGGLDHILVDEAQDTSPEQWQVVARLSEEFYAGSGAREVTRTVFAVGDEKQSIFSFQGADPAKFDEMQRYFKAHADDAQQNFETVPLTVSFRSTPIVLEAVDKVFQGPAGTGLSQGEVPPHQASRASQPGRVEIWPTLKPDDEPDRDPWDTPLDWEGPGSPRRRLAVKIAETIAGWLDHGEQLEALGRAIEPGDILILVRRRNAFVDAMVAELKQRAIPVAGADRLTLTSHIAVMDLMSLGRFVLLGDDDLALAEVLKSPLVAKRDGSPIDDDDLMVFAPRRAGSLWSAFESHAARDDRFEPACGLIRKWRNLGGWQRPFEFFSTVLGADRARERFVARLGTEVHDPVDAFLGAALHYERDGAPSLQGFIQRVLASEATIRRDMEHGKNEVRIMTVHGAKGLEAGVVFLPDTCTVPDANTDPRIVQFDHTDGVGTPVRLPAWRVSKALQTEPIEQVRAARRAEVLEENNRLLYVAMTRAKDRLYVCGYDTRKNRPPDCWYDLVHEALAPASEEMRDASGDLVAWRMEDPEARARGSDDRPGELRFTPVPPPPWARRSPPAEPPLEDVLAPSALVLDEISHELVADVAEQPLLSPLLGDDQGRFKRGRLIHALLQTLPDCAAGDRHRRAKRFLADPAHALDQPMQDEILAAALAVLDNPDTMWLFGPGSRAEVVVSGRLPLRDSHGREIRISGQIDRLAVTGTDVMIVDYKTNRPPPTRVGDVSALYVRQIAAYRLALARIYPNHTIRGALLWTEGPQFMEIPLPILDAAFTDA